MTRRVNLAVPDSHADKPIAKAKPAEVPPASDTHGFFAEAYAVFKERGVSSTSDHAKESVARSLLSAGISTGITIATRGRDYKESLLLGSLGAAGVQAVWSAVAGDDTKSCPANAPFLDRLGNKLGAVAYDSAVLGAIPGLVASGATRGSLRYFEAVLDKAPTAASALARDTKLTDAAKLEGLMPVNAWSRSPEPIGRALSNFAETPFELNGKKYASIEGFYNSLLFLENDRRDQIAAMSGLEAKLAGKGSNLAVTRYGKQMITLGSPEHHELIDQALRAKFAQNLELQKAFVETYPRPIIHDTGAPDKVGAHFPREVLEGMLSKIREEYVVAQKKLGF